MRIIFFIALMIGMLPVGAHAGPVSSSNPKSLVSAMVKLGIDAELIDGLNKYRDPWIEAKSPSDGRVFAIYFQDCDNHRECGSIMFNVFSNDKAKAKATDAEMNEWNQYHGFAYVYRSAFSQPVLRMDVNMSPGPMSETLFLRYVDTWMPVLTEFHQKFGD